MLVGEQRRVLSAPALWMEFLRGAQQVHSVILTHQLNLLRRSSLFRLSGDSRASLIPLEPPKDRE